MDPVDECASGQSNCDPNATCTDTADGFTCDCNAGYQGDGSTCSDVDECSAGSDSCDAVATCTNTGGGYTCACPAGYEDTNGDGTVCTDLCAVAACDSLATCTTSQGQAQCSCPSGYLDVNGDGSLCQLDVECQTLGCDPAAECVVDGTNVSCACPQGYDDPVGDGSSCVNIDECASGGNNCSADATCEDTEGGFNCTCNSGFSGDGVTCSDQNECSEGSDNCSANATCTNTDGGFTCECDFGYDGDGVTCANVDECSSGDNDCDDNATCQDTEGSFDCTCNEGYVGDGTSCDADDSCNLTGTFATLIEMDVQWPDVPVPDLPITIIALDGGSGTVTAWAIRRHTQNGTTLEVEEQACGAISPDVCSPLLSETYADGSSTDVWDLATMPRAKATFQLGDVPEPGDPYVGPVETSLVGLSLEDPTGPWPETFQDPGITWTDPDGDGEPGLTAYPRADGEISSACNYPYAAPPVPTETLDSRAVAAFGATRAQVQYQGVIDDCDAISGSVGGPGPGGMPLQEARAIGCVKDTGGNCNEEETAALDATDEDTAQQVLATRFWMMRVPDNVTCADVRGMTFPQ